MGSNRSIVNEPKRKVGFVMEQTLGHVTHDRNLRHWTEFDARIQPMWMPVPFDSDDNWQKMPVIRNNWTLKASLRAKELVKNAQRSQSFDALFFHTQVTALLSSRFMAKTPTIVSLDATPINVDSVGSAYDHKPSGNPVIEALKNTLNRRTFRSAKGIITWCHWAKNSLIGDYGIQGDKIRVIPPGIDLDKWQFERQQTNNSATVKLLFVGGDFRRKGGYDLLTAFKRDLSGNCELDIVTRDQVNIEGFDNIRIHHGLTSNAPELMALYANADIFVFPTLGDCLPIAIMEAMAAELPVIATNVGALSEEVDNGITGIVVPTANPDALSAAVMELVENESARKTMGLAGRSQAIQKFSGAVNYKAVLDTILGAAST